MSAEIMAAAQRALTDSKFAQAVLDGREDQPEVRRAILADVATSSEVTGFLNPQPLPPDPPPEIFSLSWWGTANPNLVACANGQHLSAVQASIEP